MKTKRCLRFFTIADYEKEEEWLNKMAAQGWNFQHTNGLLFTFVEGKPGEYEYRLDLPDEQMDDHDTENYYRFQAECGIETVGRFKEWRYLRAPRRRGGFGKADDLGVKLRMSNKAYSFATRMLCLLLCISCACVGLTLLALLFANEGTPLSDFLHGMQLGISLSVIVALTVLYVPIITRLRKRTTSLIDRLTIGG